MRLLAFAVLLLGFSVHAAEKVTRTCRILFLDDAGNAPKKLHLFDGSASQEVELTRMGFSPIYKIAAGDITLAMLASPPVADEGGKGFVIPPGAPKAAVTAAIADCYLMVASDPSNKVAPVRFQMIDASAARFKQGHMLWFNLTENRIAGTLGKRKLLVEPNSNAMIKPPANKLEDYHVNIQYLAPGAQRAEPLCETNWTCDPRSRSVFIIANTGGRVPRVLGFPDFREVDEEQ